MIEAVEVYFLLKLAETIGFSGGCCWRERTWYNYKYELGFCESSKIVSDRWQMRVTTTTTKLSVCLFFFSCVRWFENRNTCKIAISHVNTRNVYFIVPVCFKYKIKEKGGKEKRYNCGMMILLLSSSRCPNNMNFLI